MPDLRRLRAAPDRPHVAGASAPHAAAAVNLQLERVPGENQTEIVYHRAYRGFGLYLKHEYPTAPCWEWILCEGKDPIDFGDGASQEDAEHQLAAALVARCPELDQPEPEEGILRVLARRLGAAVRGTE